MCELAEILRKRKLGQEKQEEKTSGIDIQYYMRAKSFYKKIEDWLSDLVDEKLIFTSFEDITIHDHHVKGYILKAGEDKIEFIPNVRAAVGTTGKVKMKTKKGNIILIRDFDGIWKQVISKSPFKFEILTKSYLRGLLTSILS